MKTHTYCRWGYAIKKDGIGTPAIAKRFPGRRFHDRVLYAFTTKDGIITGIRRATRLEAAPYGKRMFVGW